MKKKMMALVLCVALVAVAAVGATMAYFTDTADVTNTFTVGDVKIKLDETVIKEDGITATNERAEAGNSYKLFPGKTYTKDPRVTVVNNSEDAYVRMLVTVENYNELKNVKAFDDTYYVGDVFLLERLVSGWDEDTWLYNGCTVSSDKTTATYEFRYTADKVAKSGTDRVLPALFTGFTIPGTATTKDIAALGKVQIKVVANAIQAEGFANAAEAWDNF